MSYRPLRSALHGMLAAFAPWAGKTVKQEDAVAAAEKAIRMDDLRAEQIPDISTETREIIGDLFGTVALISDEPFTLEEIDILLKEQRARTTRSLDLAGMKTALERIERWFGEFPDTGKKREDGTPLPYWFCYGSNGERDYMRSVARAALARINPVFPDLIEGLRALAHEILEQAQACCIDPDAGPDGSTGVRFTGEEGIRLAEGLYRVLEAVAPERSDQVGKTGRAGHSDQTRQSDHLGRPEVPPAAAGCEARSGEQ